IARSHRVVRAACNHAIPAHQHGTYRDLSGCPRSAGLLQREMHEIDIGGHGLLCQESREPVTRACNKPVARCASISSPAGTERASVMIVPSARMTIAKPRAKVACGLAVCSVLCA